MSEIHDQNPEVSDSADIKVIDCEASDTASTDEPANSLRVDGHSKESVSDMDNSDNALLVDALVVQSEETAVSDRNSTEIDNPIDSSAIVESSSSVLESAILPHDLDTDTKSVREEEIKERETTILPMQVENWDEHDVESGASEGIAHATDTDPMDMPNTDDESLVNVDDMAGHMMARCPWPPYLVIGGPGTGKTESLAYSCLSFLEAYGQPKPLRILLSVSTDRCADTLISDIFDPEADSHEATILRLYRPDTDIEDIPPLVQKYCFISNGKTFVPHPDALNDATIIVTTFDMIDVIHCYGDSSVASFTHILLDDVQDYPFNKLCGYLTTVSDDECIVLTVRQCVSEEKRRLVRDTDPSDITPTENHHHRPFLLNLQTVISEPDNSEPLQLNNIEKLFRNLSYSEDMLAFVNSCLVNKNDEMLPSNCTVSEKELEAVRLYQGSVSDCIYEAAAHVHAIYRKWPDTWSDPRPTDLAVIAVDITQLQVAKNALLLLSEDYNDVTFLTPDGVEGLYFNAVFIIIARDDSSAIPECFMQPASLVATLSRARTHIGLFLENSLIDDLNQSDIWCAVFNHCRICEKKCQRENAMENFDKQENEKYIYPDENDGYNDDDDDDDDDGHHDDGDMENSVIEVSEAHLSSIAGNQSNKSDFENSLNPESDRTNESRLLHSMDNQTHQVTYSSSADVFRGNKDNYDSGSDSEMERFCRWSDQSESDDSSVDLDMSNASGHGDEAKLHKHDDCFREQFIDPEMDPWLSSSYWDTQKSEVSYSSQGSWPEVEPISPGQKTTKDSDSDSDSNADSCWSRPQSDDAISFHPDHPIENYRKNEESKWMESKVMHYLIKNKEIFDNPVNFDEVDSDSEQDTGYNFPIQHNCSATEEVDMLYPDGFEIAPPDMLGLADYRSLYTFTIGKTEDITVAFSVVTDTNLDNTVVYVHVSDVTHFVNRESAVDSDAAERNCTVYIPGKDPVHMLPSRLSTDLCSLNCEQDRFAWSFVIHLDDKFNITQDIHIDRSEVNVNTALSYEIVDKFLRNDIIGDDLSVTITSAIGILKAFTNSKRIQRLGNASIVFRSLESTSESVLMVNEVSLFINEYVSKILFSAYGDRTPLLNQPNPQSLSMSWKKRYVNLARSSLALSNHYLDSFHSCSCMSNCICIKDYTRDIFTEEYKPTVEIQRARWRKVLTSHQNQDLNNLCVLVADILNYPEIVLALFEVNELMKNEVYSAAIDTHRGHHSLNLATYTTFTRPVQRYIDLVAQRMLRDISYNTDSYSLDGIDEICYAATNGINSAREAEFAEYSQIWTKALRAKPLVVEMVVSKINNSEIVIANPLALESPSILDNPSEIVYKPSYTLTKKFEIQLNNLMLSEKPIYCNSQIKLTWQERIYSQQNASDSPDVIIPDVDQVFILPIDYLIQHVPIVEMEKLSIALRSFDQPCITRATETIGSYMKPEYVRMIKHSDTGDSVSLTSMTDISSETILTKAKEPGICNFSVDLKVGTSIKVQVTSGMDKNADVPEVQLMSLTPTLDLCIQHNRYRAECFAVKPVDRVDDDSYLDICEYQRRWDLLLKYEAAEASISENDGAFIHGVTIAWMHNNGQISGTFDLPTRFLELRRIPRILGFLCVRYKDIRVSSGTMNDPVDGFFADQDSFTWVAHCNVISLQGDSMKPGYITTIEYISSSVPAPEILFSNQGKTLPCTIQWMNLSRPLWLMMQALKKVEDPSIALGLFAYTLQITNITESKELESLQSPNMMLLNIEQERAITNALNSNFSLIHGPPGTGKTATAARLVYLMAKRNELNGFQKKEKWQVMYCAPSNKAADVILGYFRKMRSEQPVVIRVYSTRIENHDFGTREQMKSKELSPFTMDKLYRRYALHHVIRERMKPYAKAILAMDRKIHDEPQHITHKFMEIYHKLVLQACREELKKAEVIVTTCTGSISSRFCFCKIRQVIIDEAGMCSQPETMIPIVEHCPLQVTLIGDHKQLQPVFISEPAKELGALQSMFERYADKAIMLTTQYRMHECIAAVPSACFYEDKLRCGLAEQSAESPLLFWPGGNRTPIVMCHVIGEEAVTTLSTNESSNRSKSNETEADIVAKIVSLLINRHGIAENAIAVLTQYRSQHSVLESKVQSFHNVTVNTVICSQGDEWDYVILSTVRSITPNKVVKQPPPTWIKKHLGFIADEHQINVALTRAKKGLIIVGNKLLLKCHREWKKLVHYYKEKGSIIEAEDFIKRLEDMTG